MSALPKKLRAGNAPLTRFKAMWRTQLTDETKVEFLGWFKEANTSHAEIRRRIHERWDIELKFDSQLSGDGALHDWCRQEQEQEQEAEWTESEEEKLKALGLKGDALRDALLEKIKGRAYLRGDAKTGLAAVDRDLKAAAISIDQGKLDLMKRKADAFDRAQAALAEGKKIKGGLTMETIEKIERELNLM